MAKRKSTSLPNWLCGFDYRRPLDEFSQVKASSGICADCTNGARCTRNCTLVVPAPTLADRLDAVRAAELAAGVTHPSCAFRGCTSPGAMVDAILAKGDELDAACEVFRRRQFPRRGRVFVGLWSVMVRSKGGRSTVTVLDLFDEYRLEVAS